MAGSTGNGWQHGWHHRSTSDRRLAEVTVVTSHVDLC